MTGSGCMVDFNNNTTEVTFFGTNQQLSKLTIKTVSVDGVPINP